MSDRLEKLLQTITELSHEFGTPDFVKGGGGNTSVKWGGRLYIKPSGTTLGSLGPDCFVALDRAELAAVYTAEIPSDPQEREAAVLDLLRAAVLPGQDLRPSVESPMHDLLEATFVVHTHSVLANGMTCAVNGPQTGARLFPEALWVPYIDPGFMLCMDLRKRVGEFVRAQGQAPTTIFLDNHGIVVSGNSAEDIRNEYGRILDTLKGEYASSNIPLELQFGEVSSEVGVSDTCAAIRSCLGDQGLFVVHERPFTVAEQPIDPDAIVYSGAFPYVGEVTSAGVRAFEEGHGYLPRLFSNDSGVFAAGSTETKAGLAMDLARDSAEIQQLAMAFGGVDYLTDRQREFIEGWEVEVFRAKQIA